MVKFEMVDGGDSVETNFKCWAIGATVEHLRFCQVRTFGVRAFAQGGEIRSARMNSGSKPSTSSSWPPSKSVLRTSGTSTALIFLHRFFRPSHDLLGTKGATGIALPDGGLPIKQTLYWKSVWKWGRRKRHRSTWCLPCRVAPRRFTCLDRSWSQKAQVRQPPTRRASWCFYLSSGPDKVVWGPHSFFIAIIFAAPPMEFSHFESVEMAFQHGYKMHPTKNLTGFIFHQLE